MLRLEGLLFVAEKMHKKKGKIRERERRVDHQVIN
jgi:hypothetical protein